MLTTVTSPVLVLIDVSCRPENVEEFGAVLREFAAACREEPGCVSFEVFRSQDQPERFALVEKYTDAQALAAHRGYPHFRELGLGRVIPLCATEEVTTYTLAGTH